MTVPAATDALPVRRTLNAATETNPSIKKGPGF